MIAISSFRPLRDCAEIALNQLRAKASWDAVFDGIILFGKYEKRLNSSRTEFVECEDFPRMSAMVTAASMSGELAAILNADIVVSPDLRALQTDSAMWRGMKKLPNAGAYTSRRYEYDPLTFDLGRATKTDGGMDFFLAWPDVWRECAKVIPGALRIGHGVWDQWMSEYFHRILGPRFIDITRYRWIFHPKHQNRKRIPTFSLSESTH